MGTLNRFMQWLFTMPPWYWAILVLFVFTEGWVRWVWFGAGIISLLYFATDGKEKWG